MQASRAPSELPQETASRYVGDGRGRVLIRTRATTRAVTPEASERPPGSGRRDGRQISARAGKNPAKSAVARKILIAAWHVLSRNEPFKAPTPRAANPASASSRCFLAA